MYILQNEFKNIQNGVNNRQIFVFFTQILQPSERGVKRHVLFRVRNEERAISIAFGKDFNLNIACLLVLLLKLYLNADIVFIMLV